MKNYEKYAEKIKKLGGVEWCSVIAKPNALKPLGIKCENISCSQCGAITTLWLLEEYEEPEFDWSKVEVDTPILVRDSEDTESATVVWLKRYFAEYKDGLVYAWTNGRTSWNEDRTHGWSYAKLAESEETK